MKKMYKNVLTLLLVFALSIGSVLPANAMGKDSTGTAIVEDGEYKVISQYDKSRNEIKLTTYKNGELIEDLLIDLDKELENYEEEQKESEISLFNESSGRVLERKVTTILNYEYERWYYPNFQNGRGKFWNFRTFSNGYRMMYQEPNSRYTASINEFVSGVETIKEKELIVGVTAAVAIAAAIASNGVSVVLKARIQAILESLGIIGAITLSTQLYNAIRKCQNSWNVIYG